MITPLDILSVETWIILGTLLVLGRYYLHRKWRYLKNLGIPHEPPSVLRLGNTIGMVMGKNVFEYDNMMKKKYGPVWGGYLVTSPTITIHDPDMLRQIYIKDFSSFPIREHRLTKSLGKELNSALGTVSGDDWKRTRSTMTPTFSTSKLKYMAGIVEWCGDNALAHLDRKVKNLGGVINPRDFFSRVSLDVVCSAAFSTKVDTLDDTKKEPEIAKQARKLMSDTLSTIAVLLCYLFPPFEWLAETFEINIYAPSAIRYFKQVTNSVIKRREENPHETAQADLLQLMLNSKIDDEELKKGVDKGMTKTEILGNSMVMIMAGYENTASVMCFLSYNLAWNPDIQKQLQKEIDDMMETHGKFDYDGVQSLKLLEMCINETLRFQNPVIKNQRFCTKEITINGLTIPKGSAILIPAYALGRDPEYWEEPEKFNPERMRDMTQIDPMVFQAFGAGPRNCIGMRFALMEIKITIAKVLHKFSFAPAKNTPKPPLKLKLGISVRPEKDHDLKVIPRTADEK